LDYPKIETLFDRDEKFKVMEGKFRLPEFEALKDISWCVTEKVDGTNVRIEYEPQYQPNKNDPIKHEYAGHSVQFGGHTEKAQLHPNLIKYLENTFTLEKMAKAFPSTEGKPMIRATVYGEGYGPKIQSGGKYRKDIAVRIFDVFIQDEYNFSGGWWLEPENVADIASKLGVKTMPGLDLSNMREIVSAVKSGIRSSVALEDNPDTHLIDALIMEGVVARAKPLLFTRRGERIIFKLKTKDFAQGRLEA